MCIQDFNTKGATSHGDVLPKKGKDGSPNINQQGSKAAVQPALGQGS